MNPLDATKFLTTTSTVRLRRGVGDTSYGDAFSFERGRGDTSTVPHVFKIKMNRGDAFVMDAWAEGTEEGLSGFCGAAFGTFVSDASTA